MTKTFSSRGAAREFVKANGGKISKAAPWTVTLEDQEREGRIMDVRGLVSSARTLDDIAACYDALNAAGLGEPVTTELDEEIGFRAAQIEADQQLNQVQVAAVSETKAGKPWIRASVAPKPTKLVWCIADSMPGASRKEVMEACVAQGVASGTARTQYQHWFKQKNDSANEPRATIVDGVLIPATRK